MMPAPRRPALSFVVPVRDEEANVEPLHAELTAVARAIGRDHELVFVDDGSRDATLDRLRALAAGDARLRVVELDGNFGEAAALSAGFAAATGEIVITLDGDGQNDPADAPRLLARLEEGFDVVSGRRERRKEALPTRVLPSLVANRLIVLATGVPVHDCGCGLKAYRRNVVAGASLPRGFNRFLPAILGVDPKRVAEVPVRDRARGSGRSHYGLSRTAIVLRDLPALPLLTRLRVEPVRGARAAGALAALLVLAAPGLAVAGRTIAAAGAVGAALVLHLARFNLRRVARARADGVFRVRRVHHP
jgi:glycosyltransferase involved in cell wall biosynthesis